MKHTLTILLHNQSGALMRLAGQFSARGLNIESLFINQTHDPVISQLIVVLKASEERVERLLAQLRKQVEVLSAGRLLAVVQPPLPVAVAS